VTEQSTRMRQHRRLRLPARIALIAVAATAVATAAVALTTTAGAATTGGCGKTPTLASGTRSIQTSGKNRTYILRVPDNYNNSHAYRLIFAFHWRGGTAAEVASGGTSGTPWSYYGQQEQSNNTAILVAPQGFDNGWANSGGEDVVFVDDMVKQIETALCVDTTQLFATGFSWGGGMSYALACARANVFRAVAVFSGAVISGCSGGTQPIAYLGLHGVRDNVLPIASGRGLRDTFVRNNGCTTQNPPEPAQGSLTHIVTAYSGCRAGYPVVWAAFDNGHMPGPVDGTLTESGIRTWTKAEVWKFFSQFGSSPSTTGPAPTTAAPTTRPVPTTSAPPVTTSPPQSGAGCRVTYTVNAWNTGLTTDVTITNTGSTAVNGWSLVFTLPSGQVITSGWNATYSPTSGQVTARNVSYNGTIAANSSVSIGFQANHTGNTAKPSSFTLNGAACAVA
jgi:poly(3-hydroxybutyrate) depolymerase